MAPTYVATLAHDLRGTISFFSMRCSCGTNVEDGWEFCASCGTPVIKQICSCGAKLKQGWKFCSSCGAPASGQPSRGRKRGADGEKQGKRAAAADEAAKASAEPKALAAEARKVGAQSAEPGLAPSVSAADPRLEAVAPALKSLALAAWPGQKDCVLVGFPGQELPTLRPPFCVAVPRGTQLPDAPLFVVPPAGDPHVWALDLRGPQRDDHAKARQALVAEALRRKRLSLPFSVVADTPARVAELADRGLGQAAQAFKPQNRFQSFQQQQKHEKQYGKNRGKKTRGKQ